MLYLFVSLSDCLSLFNLKQKMGILDLYSGDELMLDRFVNRHCNDDILVTM